MFKTGTCRLLSVFAAIVMIVCALSLAVLADNVVLDTNRDTGANNTEKYKANVFDPEHPELGGWTLSCTNPEKGGISLNYAEGKMGFYDSAIKYGIVTQDLTVTYILAEDEQFNIKNYGSFTRDRRAQGGASFLCNLGAQYRIIIETVDGQKASVDANWLQNPIYPNATVSFSETTNFQSALVDIEGNPLVKSISIMPYISEPELYIREGSTSLYGTEYQAEEKVQETDENGEPVVDENGEPVYTTQTVTKTSAGEIIYFLFGDFTFKEAAAPDETLVAVKDTYDGTTVTAHNGKITGLDADKTYKYGGIFSKSADLITVTGVTEIENLVGGVYEVRVAEEGKMDSAPVYVTVPKLAHTATLLNINGTAGSWTPYHSKTAAEDRSIQSLVPYSGYWTSGAMEPYFPSAETGASLALRPVSTVYLRGEWDVAAFESGASKTNRYIANNEVAGEWYRRNLHAITYTFTPEEQFYGGDANSVAVTLSHKTPWKFEGTDYKQVGYAVKFYCDTTDVEPVVATGRHYGTDNQSISVNLKHLPDDALVTRMEIIYYWDVPAVEKLALAAAADTYSRLNKVVITASKSPAAPELEIVGSGVEGEFKAIGFVPYNHYEFSVDGINWSATQSLTELSGLKAGDVRYVRTRDINNLVSEAVMISVPADASAQPKAAVAGGAKITGLDADLAYEYSAYNIFGYGDWTAVEAGATELEVANGVWAVRVKAADGVLAGPASFVLVGDNEMKPYFLDSTTNKMNANTTATDGKKVGPFEIGMWSSDIGYSEIKDGTNTATQAIIRSNGGTSYPNTTGAMHIYAQTYNFNYANPGDQMISITELGRLQLCFTGSSAMSVYPWEGKTCADFRGIIRVYVAGSNVNYYDVEFAWAPKYTGFAWVNFPDSLPSSAQGYVIGMSIRPWGATPSDWEVQDDYADDTGAIWANGSRINYGFAKLQNWATSTPVAAPVLSLSDAGNGQYEISGFDAALKYAISSDGVNFIDLPAGTTSYKVDSVGTYYARILGSYPNALSDIAVLEIKGAQEAVTGLEVEGNKIIKLDPEKTYEYATYTMKGYGEWTSVTGVTELELDTGLWAVRLPAGNGYIAGDAQLLHIAGANYGTMTWAVSESKDYVLGSWNNASATTTGNTWRLQLSASGTDDAVYESIKTTYSMANDEIIKAKDMSALRFTMGNGVMFTPDKYVKAAVRFHIADGKQDYYDYTFYYSGGKEAIADLASILPADEEGYLIGISILPFADIMDGTTINSAWNCPLIAFTDSLYQVEGWTTSGDAAADKKDQNRWRIPILRTETLEKIEIKPIENAYITALQVILDPAVKYEVSINGNNFTSVIAGTTNLTVPVGDFLIRVAANGTNRQTAPVFINSQRINPVFTTSNNLIMFNSGVNLTKGDFVEGVWANNPDEFKITPYYATTEIGAAVKLSDVSYKYTLIDSEKFVIDDHPYISVDFGNTLANMGLYDNVIPDAIAEVDIYVEGEDTPYTVSGAWKGSVIASGVSPNRIGYNVVEEHPEISGKTVTAIDIRPYSNIDLTPADYDVTNTAAHSVQFMLYHAGFFDTPENWKATTDNFARNTLTGISATCDIFYSVGAEFNPADVVVKEVFSDDSSAQVKNYTYELPENFAAEAGSYTVTVSHRGFTEEVVINVGLDHIEFKTAPTKTEYFEGDLVDLTGMELVAVLADGTEIPVTAGYEVAETVTADMTAITVTYGGKEVTHAITVTALALESIEINTYPTKVSEGGYVEGDPVDLTGLTIKATYNSGKTEIVELANIEYVYSADFMTRGGTLTVTYGGMSIEGITLPVNSKPINEIVISTPAKKLVYFKDEALDTTGLVLTVKYEDGTSETIADKELYIASPAVLDTIGDVIVTVTYEGFDVTYTVSVREITDAFVLAYPTKTEYIVGEEFDPTGAELYVMFNGGDIQEYLYAEDLTFVHDPFTTAGEYDVTLVYGTFTDTFVVTVVASEEPVVLESITVTAPTKTEYTVGDTLDTAGMTVTANYSNETTADVTAQATVDTTVLETAGTVTVTVTYEDKTATFEVTVKEVPVVLESITVTAPTKTEYTVGDTLDTAGMTVIANYSNGSTVDVTAQATVDATVLETAGTVTVTVTYEDKTATFEVTVKEVPVVLESITVTAPTKTEYTVGDTLDTAGMTVIANYSNGSTVNVTAQATVNTTVLNTAGTATVTVTYEGKTATFTVTVKAAVQSDIVGETAIEGTDITWKITADGTLVFSGTGNIPDFKRAARPIWASTYYRQILGVVIEEGITGIGNYALFGLGKATTVQIPSTVKYLGVGFIDTTAIKELTVPSGVVTIRNNAFVGAQDGLVVTLPESVKDIHGNITAGNKTITLKAPTDSYVDKFANYYPEKYPTFGSVTFESDGTTAKWPVKYFGTSGSDTFYTIYARNAAYYLFEYSGQGSMRKFAGYEGRNIGNPDMIFAPLVEKHADAQKYIYELIVHEGVAELGNWAFHMATKATSLVLNEGLTRIGMGAFRNVSRVKTMRLPETTKYIETHAFQDCESLRDLYIPDSVIDVANTIFTKVDPANLAQIKIHTDNEYVISKLSAEYPTITIVPYNE